MLMLVVLVDPAETSVAQAFKLYMNNKLCNCCSLFAKSLNNSLRREVRAIQTGLNN